MAMVDFTELFAWGDDKFGQLGLGDKRRGENYCIPRFWSFGIKIKKISCGEAHAAFISKDNLIYTMGKNNEGQLGIGSTQVQHSTSPCLVEYLSRTQPLDISWGWSHTAVVTQNGEVWSWGQGDFGALANGTLSSSSKPLRAKIKSGVKVVAISWGGRHTAAIGADQSMSRKLYMAGAGDSGQLGNGVFERELVLTCIGSDNVAQVCGGVHHTLFVTIDGAVFAMGENKFGQLGTGNKKASNSPMRIRSLDGVSIRQVSCGHHSAAVSESGQLYLWGTGVFGEVLSPKLVPDIEVRDMSIGGCFGSAVDMYGHVWTWGSNTSGELGVGDFEPRTTPVMIKSLKQKQIQKISCGGSFVIAMGEESSKLKPGQPQNSSRSSERAKSLTPSYTQKELPVSHFQSINNPNALHNPNALNDTQVVDFEYQESFDNKLNEIHSWLQSEMNKAKSIQQEKNQLLKENQELKSQLQQIAFQTPQNTPKLHDQNQILFNQLQSAEVVINDLQAEIKKGKDYNQVMREAYDELARSHKDMTGQFNETVQMVLALDSLVQQVSEKQAKVQDTKTLFNQIQEQDGTISQMARIIEDWENKYDKLKQENLKLKERKVSLHRYQSSNDARPRTPSYSSIQDESQWTPTQSSRSDILARAQQYRRRTMEVLGSGQEADSPRALTNRYPPNFDDRSSTNDIQTERDCYEDHSYNLKVPCLDLQSHRSSRSMNKYPDNPMSSLEQENRSMNKTPDNPMSSMEGDHTQLQSPILRQLQDLEAQSLQSPHFRLGDEDILKSSMDLVKKKMGDFQNAQADIEIKMQDFALTLQTTEL